MSEQENAILFTAFERSGDEHAAPAIAHLKRMRPDLKIYAWGGEEMQAAGAEIIEFSTSKSVLGTDAFGEIATHIKRMGRIKKWLRANPIIAHVPTDSPAANWGICKAVKNIWGHDPKYRAKVIHLVCPQVWAWAPWRVKRLQRWSDMVMCLLPFETDWLDEKNVPSTFIGHPLFEEELPMAEIEQIAADYPDGQPRFGILPGSRKKEITRNWPVQLAVFHQLKKKYPGMQAVVAGSDDKLVKLIQELTPQWPEGMHMTTGQSDSVIHWSDAILAVSGTISLHICRQGKPMALLYQVPPPLWYGIGWWITNTRNYTLPNLIAGGLYPPHVIPEFIPFWGDSTPIGEEMITLFEDESKREKQLADQQDIISHFHGHEPGKESAEAILKVLDRR